jgi:hypothetical protein
MSPSSYFISFLLITVTFYFYFMEKKVLTDGCRQKENTGRHDFSDLFFCMDET